jgi:transcriptional regulator with XRE-family HTH domain
VLNNGPVGNGHIGHGTMPARAGSPETHVPENGRDQREAGMVARLKIICCGRNATVVGSLTNTHPETARRYLSGKSTPHPVFLATICDALGISEAWLLCGRGSPYREAGPHGEHVTPREAAVAVRTSLWDLESRMAALEEMLEYPRRASGRRSGASSFVEARPMVNGDRSYGATTTATDPSGGATGPGPVRNFRLRQRA